jgi:hypothetical protein
MRTALLVLMLAITSGVCAKPPEVRFWGTVKAENRSVELGVIAIKSAQALTAADFDSALAMLRFKRELVIQMPRCSDADSSILAAILGRLTDRRLPGIEPRGEWQFGQPIVILLPVSGACPPVLALNQLRWVEIRYGGNLDKAIRRAKRLGEMYRVQQQEEMNFMFHK